MNAFNWKLHALEVANKIACMPPYLLKSGMAFSAEFCRLSLCWLLTSAGLSTYPRVLCLARLAVSPENFLVGLC